MVGRELNSIPRTVSMVWVRVTLRDVPLRLYEGRLERLPNLCWNYPNSVVSNLSITIFISPLIKMKKQKKKKKKEEEEVEKKN